MSLRTTFANLANGLSPLALFDQMFADMAGCAVIPCTVSGSANALTLTERSNAYQPTAYADNQLFGFVAGAASTNLVTVGFRSLGAKNLYEKDGTTQVTTDGLQLGTYYIAAYSSALNGNTGGFYLANGLPAALSAVLLAGTGILAKTSGSTVSGRTLQAPAAGLTISNPAGIAGDPTFALANDLAALEALSTTGIARRTGVSTWDTAAGITDLASTTANRLFGTNGSGASGLVTLPAAGIALSAGALALANDLAAVEGLSSTGIARRTGTDTWSVGTLVTNAELATAAAYTLKGNTTGSSASVSDFTIGSLTQKVSPAATDLVLLQDQAASGQLKYALVSAVAAAGSVSSLNGQTGGITLVARGTTFNLGLAASVAGSALTIAIKDASGADPTATSPVVISFRNATAATGTPSTLTVAAAASLTISSGSTLGAINNTPFHLLIVGFNDAGTFRLGVMNASAAGIIYPCAAEGIASSTAEGGAGAADSAGVFYTGTAVSSKAYVVLGRMSWTATPLATAGTWANGPDRIRLVDADFKYPGDLIQSLTTGDSVNSTGTTIIPIDDTIPQNTEGTQFYSQAITPTSQANWLSVRSRIQAGSSSAVWILAGLFQDSTANAIQSTGQNITGGYWAPLDFDLTMLANTVSSTTFKVRVGPGTAATVGVNGIGATRELGGTLYSYIQVSEYQG